MKRRPISPASKAQRSKVLMEGRCRECWQPAIDPAHVIARAHGGCDEPDCVIPLCRPHHRDYDAGHLDILPVLTKTEQAHAVNHVGIVGALRRLTNQRLAA